MTRLAPRTAGIIAACLVVIAAAAVFAVRAYGAQGSVTVLATWTGGDEEVFRQKVIDPFEAKTGIHVTYQGSSAESQVLAADSETGRPPDVTIMSGPGELANYAAAGQLTSLDDLVDTADYGGIWTHPVPGEKSAHTYWVPVKADLKSLVWHSEDLDGNGLTDAAKEPASWCLGMGADATSGWPGTDWIEDILLQQEGPTVYNQWATGQLPWDSAAVKRAFATWKRIVNAGNEKIAEHALTTDYGDASRGLTSSEMPCDLEHQSGFIRDNAAWRQAHATYQHSSQLLGAANLLKLAPAHQDNAWEVSGDLAAVFNSTPQSRKFIQYLTSASVQRDWNTVGTGFSVDGKVKSSDYADTTTRKLADTLRDPKATHCWDASDAMPPIVRDAFTRAVVRYLAEPQDLDAQLASIRTASRRAQGKDPEGRPVSGKDAGGRATFLSSVCGG